MRPSTRIPATPRSLRRVARISPTTAQDWSFGCWINTKVFGAGRSVQCVWEGMFDCVGIEEEVVVEDEGVLVGE